ncbi:hypothetical protein AR457_03715 [Streptomyces agglomeratus]|uniref:DUF998 domain-containing protein n=1 Tax=Streptomyces agglomeratus TaxID=285458 RepID=A0A1E5P2H8_9ACTN|nr:DUF998 domain-containing protein [Streptomyces agglomeratus]OEJ23736.1 hypothetical protein AS594_03820 [Streptomyces agglomeratus]OEJ43328.1 hypothetical protein AR457_03715 [Streptomyces agglomeratus]OEJ54754.1 hypothetical protein BGK72_32055 [Streptomyces agglomeratus]
MDLTRDTPDALRQPAPPLRLHRPARGRRRLTAAVLTGAALLYNGWLLELSLPTGLDYRHSYVSELFAADQPFRALFGGMEAACAALVMAGALLARDLLPDAAARTGWWALFGFGTSSLADVLLPMGCAPSLEPDCQAVHPWHTVTSGLVHFFLFASMVAFCVAAAPTPSRAPVIRRWGPRLLAGAMVSAVTTVGPLIGHPGWHGVPQRAHVLLVGLWFALLAREVAAPDGTGPGAPYAAAGSPAVAEPGQHPESRPAGRTP